MRMAGYHYGCLSVSLILFVLILNHLFFIALLKGPDEVHIAQIGKIELRRAAEITETLNKQKQRTAELISGKAKL